MTDNQGPLLNCLECGKGSYHHSLPDRVWDECENGHVVNVRMTQDPDFDAWLARPGVQTEVDESCVIERGVFPDVRVVPPPPPGGPDHAYWEKLH